MVRCPLGDSRGPDRKPTVGDFLRHVVEIASRSVALLAWGFACHALKAPSLGSAGPFPRTSQASSSTSQTVAASSRPWAAPRTGGHGARAPPCPCPAHRSKPGATVPSRPRASLTRKKSPRNEEEISRSPSGRVATGFVPRRHRRGWA